jgi:hypothetical protein
LAVAWFQQQPWLISVQLLVPWLLSVSIPLQAFQCSEQAVQLCKDGWFKPETEPSGISKMQNPKEPNVEQAVIVASECFGSIHVCACKTVRCVRGHHQHIMGCASVACTCYVALALFQYRVSCGGVVLCVCGHHLHVEAACNRLGI